MKKRYPLIAIVFMALIYGSNAQVTRQDLASGPKKTDFTSFSIRPLTQGGSFSIGTLAFFQKFHQQEDEMFDEAEVHSTVYWNINEAISIGPGPHYISIAVAVLLNGSGKYAADSQLVKTLNKQK